MLQSLSLSASIILMKSWNSERCLEWRLGWAKKENPFRDVVSGCHQKKNMATHNRNLIESGWSAHSNKWSLFLDRSFSPERCVPLTKPPAFSWVVASDFENVRQWWYFPIKNHSCLMFFDLSVCIRRKTKISPNDSGFMNFSHQFHSKSLQMLTLKCLLLVTCVVYRPCELDSHCASDALCFMHIVIPYSMQYFERRAAGPLPRYFQTGKNGLLNHILPLLALGDFSVEMSICAKISDSLVVG